MSGGRRGFLERAGLVGLGGWLAGRKAVAAAEPEPATASPPIQTPHLPKLAWRMEGGVKAFDLVAEPVRREFLPGKTVDVWGYNGSMPGPTIEVNEGDRVRIRFRNALPEPTTVHWHGLEVPLDMDGVPAISQPLVEPGGTFTYEFMLHQHGTFFYHSHMAMQQMLGMIGLFVIHPRAAYRPAVQKDFGLILQGWGILPSNTVPNTMSMEFNWLTMNGKAGPAIAPLLVRLGDRVRIRFVNLGMDHHPMHLHGNQFVVTGTEGGRVPETQWHPMNTVLVGVAQARSVEFDARRAGDWMLHCHLPHHMMNQMVSMVGPVSHAGTGMAAGRGMPEGMGMVQSDHALSPELGPSLGRGIGITTTEKPVSNAVGQTSEAHMSQTPERHTAHGGSQPTPAAGRVPGYPQDMWMTMDDAVASPETEGLAPGWTGAMMGMMTVVRVLPPDRYDAIMARVRSGEGHAPAAPHSHHEGG